MQTNHLSHFLLTKDSELLALLNKAAPAKGETRVVNHSGGARKFSPPQLQAKYLGKNGGNLGGNGSSMLFCGARCQRYHETCVPLVRTPRPARPSAELAGRAEAHLGVVRVPLTRRCGRRSWPTSSSRWACTIGSRSQDPSARRRTWPPPTCRCPARAVEAQQKHSSQI